MKEPTVPIAFLFNASYPEFSGWYGQPCDRSVLSALAKSDTKGDCTSLIQRGDLFLYTLCEKIASIARKNEGGRQSMQNQTVIDKDLYSLVFWDFVDSVASGWHTTDDELFPLLLMENRIYGFYLPTLNLSLRESMDKRLKGMPAYIGAFEVDRGNPLHVSIFDRQLIDDSFVHNGYLSIWSGPDGDSGMFSQTAGKVPGIKIKLMSVDEFKSSVPLPTDAPPSPRGLISKSRILLKKKPSHYQKIAVDLFFTNPAKSIGQDFEYFLPAGFEKINIPQEKLVGYVLNENHPNGGAKAKLFHSLLGIGPADWRYLASQLARGLANVNLNKTRVTDHGIQYHALIPIRGMNGKTKTILTGWIVQNNQPARLVTAYIAPEKEQLSVEAPEPPIVPKNLLPPQSWEYLFKLASQAGEAAGLLEVPTPMKIAGEEVIFEGMCGFSYVSIPDARSGFARWLRKNGKGREGIPGQRFYSPLDTQSVDRASAYTQAFASVLRENGVECEVKTFLD